MMALLALAAWPALALALGVSALLAWNLRLFRRARAPWRTGPLVSVLIPARNEARAIEAAVRAACAQTAFEVEVVVLDDGSTDATEEILRRLASETPRLRVVGGEPMPPGWAGKAWACWQLASRHARGEWCLFVDADVRLDPDAVARALATARDGQADFVSAFPRQVVGSAGEALLVPLIHLVLLAYLPMALLRRVPRPSLSAGCGQFMLVRRAAYLAAGGHGAIRATLHDGIMLARRMKAAGFALEVLDGTDLASCRMYEGLTATWRGFTRNAYEALGSPVALATMLLLNGAVWVLPFVAAPWLLVASGPTAPALAWGLAGTLGLVGRAALARRFGHPAWVVPATPLAVAMMLGLQCHSFFNHLTRRPVIWRDRAYPGAAPTGGG